jgi:hypothetical protein
LNPGWLPRSVWCAVRAAGFACGDCPPYHDAQRARGATHQQALRSLANRLVGILHGCLRHDTRHNKATAWHTALDQAAA